MQGLYSLKATQASSLAIKVTRGILEYRVIRNDSGIDPSYCKTTDRLDKQFHHEVGASVGSATSTRLAAVRSHSRCKNGK